MCLSTIFFSNLSTMCSTKLGISLYFENSLFGVHWETNVWSTLGLGQYISFLSNICLKFGFIVVFVWKPEKHHF